MRHTLNSSVFIAVLLAAPILISGCKDETSVVVLDATTDMVPSIDFDEIRTEVLGDLSTITSQTVGDDDWRRGVRVGTWDLANGDRQLEIVALLAGEEVQRRRLIVRVTGPTAVSVVLTRNCRGVACPGAGDSAAAAACLGGRCVPETCLTGAEPECGDPQCQQASECPLLTAACVSPACEFGICLPLTPVDACMSGMVCSPDDGCVARRVSSVDAATDALPDGSDAGVDTCTALLGVPCTSVAAEYIKASNTGEGDAFGWSVAISGDGSTLVVGARLEDSASTGVDGIAQNDDQLDSGAVFVFARSGETWTQEAYLKAEELGDVDVFGEALALSNDGSTLAVAARLEDSDSTTINGDATSDAARNSGAVYIFARSAGWTQQAYLKASNAESEDSFGSSVAISGDGNTVLVGASAEDSSGGSAPADNTAPDSGAAYVFMRTGTDWAEDSYLKSPNPQTGDRFGTSVAISADGQRLAIGAPDEDSSGRGPGAPDTDDLAPASGGVYVFGLEAAGWRFDALLKAANADAGDQFGYRVAMSADGTFVLVGAFDEGGGSRGVDGDDSTNGRASSGAAYLFERAAVWRQTAYLKASNAESGDRFGNRVALSSDGSTVAIGALEDGGGMGATGDGNSNSAQESGAVYIFRRSGERWAEAAYIKAPAPDPQDQFGGAVSLNENGSRLLVGAPQEGGGAMGVGGAVDNRAPGSGATYIYSFAP
ncbi:MAG: hypothetical protein ACI9KE_001066 [Polyangiales bacterium]|jgi:hypothetical protein